MDGGEKNMQWEAVRHIEESSRKKYFEESFCAKCLSNFFLMIVMCHEISDGHGKLARGMRNFLGREMVCGGGCESFPKAIYR